MNFFANEEKKGVSKPQLVPQGRHEATLVDIRNGKGKHFRKPGDRPTITFVFQVADTVVLRTCTASRDIRGKLFEIVTELGGAKPSENILADKNLYTEYLQSMIGKKFDIQVEHSANGIYANVVSIQPLRKEP